MKHCSPKWTICPSPPGGIGGLQKPSAGHAWGEARESEDPSLNSQLFLGYHKSKSRKREAADFMSL